MPQLSAKLITKATHFKHTYDHTIPTEQHLKGHKSGHLNLKEDNALYIKIGKLRISIYHNPIIYMGLRRYDDLVKKLN